jgi:hypothetical protein
MQQIDSTDSSRAKGQELVVHSEEPNQSDKIFGTIFQLLGSRLLVRNGNLELLVRLLCGIRQPLVLQLGLGLVRRQLLRELVRILRRRRRIGVRIGSDVISISYV